MDPVTKFKVACINGDLATIKRIFNSVDINYEDFNGDTGLNLACRYGDINIAKFLIYKGADVNYKNFNGVTALMLSCKHGYVNVVELLIFYNADLDIESRIGYNAFHYAFMYHKIKIVNIFLSLDYDYMNFYKNVTIDQFQHIDTVRIRSYTSKFDEYKTTDEYRKNRERFLSYKSSQIFIYTVLISDGFLTIRNV